MAGVLMPERKKKDTLDTLATAAQIGANVYSIKSGMDDSARKDAAAKAKSEEPETSWKDQMDALKRKQKANQSYLDDEE